MSNAHKAGGNTRRIDKTPEQVKKAWTMYDWANSVYSLVITTAIFPIFFNALTSERNEAGEIINDTVIFWGR